MDGRDDLSLNWKRGKSKEMNGHSHTGMDLQFLTVVSASGASLNLKRFNGYRDRPGTEDNACRNTDARRKRWFTTNVPSLRSAQRYPAYGTTRNTGHGCCGAGEREGNRTDKEALTPLGGTKET